jgi:trk system potassium uptake protein TrkH
MTDRTGKKRRKTKRAKSPQAILVWGFASAIAAGTLLLLLPFAHQPGRVGFLDAIFTATSAVCVTGLVVVDTGTDFTLFGQIVILLLIQLGGLGVMTFAAIAFRALGMRLSLVSQAAVQDSMFQKDVAVLFKSVFGGILALTLIIEFIGAVVLFVFLAPEKGVSSAAFSSIFHSVSAFCNAGFSLYPDSLIGLRGTGGLAAVVAALIVLGGLGHTTLYEIMGLAKRKLTRKKDDGRIARLSLHASTALWTSAALIVVGAVMLMVFGMTSGEKNIMEIAANALFQSVTARTAGFNTIDIGALPTASLFLLTTLMFIGGSPGSCAGGVKTTTVAVWLAKIKSSLAGEKEVSILGRRLSDETVSRAGLLMGLAILWNIIGLMILSATEPGVNGAGLSQIMFEQVSAFGTVGLSTGITTSLSVSGRLWIILTMFVGRLGPLTMAVWIVNKKRVNTHYPKGEVMIG